MTLPVGPRGRFLAIALLAIPVVLLLHFAVFPLLAAYGDIRDDIAEAQQEIPRYRRIIAERPALEAAAKHLQHEQSATGLLLEGDNPALAAAGLQRRLQDIAEQHGARVLSVRVDTPVADGPLQRVSVQARLQADSRGLRDPLQALETGAPYLFVESLNINARAARRGTPTDALDVRLTLSGLRVPDTAQPQGDGHG